MHASQRARKRGREPQRKEPEREPERECHRESHRDSILTLLWPKIVHYLWVKCPLMDDEMMRFRKVVIETISRKGRRGVP